MEPKLRSLAFHTLAKNPHYGGRISHGRASDGRMFHGRVPHARASHECVSYGCVMGV